VDEVLLRSLTPAVLGILVRRGADFSRAEDAVQDALVEAVRVWPARPAAGPEGLAGRGGVAPVPRRDAIGRRPAPAGGPRRGRAAPGPAPAVDDTLQLYFLCAHPSLTPSSAVALTLRAVGGLTTGRSRRPTWCPEATMAQRISRAKRTVAGRAVRPARRRRHRAARALPRLQRGLLRRRRPRRRGRPAHPAAGRVLDHPEVRGTARPHAAALRPARRAAPRPTAAWCRSPSRTASRWDTAAITEGVAVLQAALARDRLGSTRPRRRSRRCTPTRAPRPRPTGCRSWSGTTSSCA
jgi:predicted RNA polymerase sigma factor